jgi:alcohol dehydrogenase, propanol-preferring
VHVLRLELVQLRKRLCHGRESSVHVEAHGVLGRRGGDDERGVAGPTCETLDLSGQRDTDTPPAKTPRDVEVRELSHLWADVKPDHPDPHEPVVFESAEAHRAFPGVALQLRPLRRDGVLADTDWIPRSSAEVACPGLEPLAALDEERVDSLCPIDLTDAAELAHIEPAIRERHRACTCRRRQTADMRAMVLDAAKTRLRVAQLRDPTPGDGEVLLAMRACGVCRTDLHIVDGELAHPKLPLVPGHQLVGEVITGGRRFEAGARVGVPWLGWTCGECRSCKTGAENLCDRARFTGYDIDGGYAQLAVADERFCFTIPDGYRDEQAAPLLCAGLIGFRSLRLAGDPERLGLYGFGASAHIVCQVAVAQGRHVYAGTREGDDETQEFARSLGATWTGDALTGPPDELDAVIVFAPAGELVPAALRHIRKGGAVVCAGIHMTDIPGFPYESLWGERVIRSVANLTRADGDEFLRLAPTIPIQTEVETFPLEEANEALDRLRRGSLRGAAVLLP